MSIAFEELEDSPRIQIQPSGTVAWRRFRVAWADWQEFARQLVGTYRVTAGKVRFVAPLAFPGMDNLLVDELEVEPLDGSCPVGSAVSTLTSGTNAYPAGGALVTATYRTLFDEDNQSRKKLPKVPSGTILTYHAELAAEYVSMPGRTWNWKNAASPRSLAEDIFPGILLPHGNFELRWQRVPLPPWDAIRALRGKVNQQEFLGAPAGTVLFLGARATRQFQFIERGGFWQLGYSFAESTRRLNSGGEVGWNYFYREVPIGGEHWLQIEDALGNPPYAAADFSPLFQLES